MVFVFVSDAWRAHGSRAAVPICVATSCFFVLRLVVDSWELFNGDDHTWPGSSQDSSRRSRPSLVAKIMNTAVKCDVATQRRLTNGFHSRSNYHEHAMVQQEIISAVRMRGHVIWSRCRNARLFLPPPRGTFHFAIKLQRPVTWSQGQRS